MNSKPDTSTPVNENEKYFAVFKGKLGPHRLLFGAEMDGVHPDPTPPKRYVELKTSRIITDEKQEWIFRRLVTFIMAFILIFSKISMQNKIY